MRKTWMWTFLVAVLVAAFFTVTGAFAQNATSQAAGSVSVAMEKLGSESMTLKQIMHTGGGVMYVLAAASVLTLAFVIYFLYTMRVSQVVPRFLHREIVEKIRSGSLDDVRRACEYRSCALSAVVLSAVDYVRTAPDPDPTLLRDVMEGEGARQADVIQGQPQYLLDIAVLSPMLGLLGTVVGMLQAFDAVAIEGAVARPVMLAAGVSKALVATAFGLLVGIPAMGFYGYFRRRAARVVSYLEVASVDVLTALSGRSGR